MAEPGEGLGAIQLHAIAVHRIMVRDSYVDPGTGPRDKDRVYWEGSVGRVFAEAKVNQGYHTPLMKLLTEMDCLAQVRKGNRAIKSKYLLLRSPESVPLDEWPSFRSVASKKPLTIGSGRAILLEERIERLENRLGTLNVQRALAEIAVQISELRQLITESKD